MRGTASQEQTASGNTTIKWDSAGYKLAMRILQSDIYSSNPDIAELVDDALVEAGLVSPTKWRKAK